MLIRIELNNTCNFTCGYCAGRSQPQFTMTKEQAIIAFHKVIPNTGCHMVVLQGEGEPTLLPYLWDLARYVRNLGHQTQTTTNGSYRLVKRLSDNFDLILVSLDTVDPEEAERIGRHNLPRVLENIRALAKLVRGRLILTAVNYGQCLQGVIQLAKELKVGYRVQPLERKDDYVSTYGPKFKTTPRPLR